ncbi:hypothetical protein [Calothrix sp. NIES-3974]|nr:hypothetical protein [Calothrix sp. NIES-3974]
MGIRLSRFPSEVLGMRSPQILTELEFQTKKHNWRKNTHSATEY